MSPLSGKTTDSKTGGGREQGTKIPRHHGLHRDSPSDGKMTWGEGSGSQQARDPDIAPFPTYTEDIDQETTVAPTIVHETVRPHVHEVKEEQITRDIHTHEVFHYEQPVYETEVLPARHFVLDKNGNKVEVSEKDLSGCTGPNQKWHIGENGKTCPGGEEK
ncbi:hypothetical protein B0H63DRAFT_537287 [Podospora didyma]|uniref:Uncharacterized protein n=1 Tax=Podospora didyma TaxID=330526 RepID=A0AAE0NX80_9PEZI|nr:hypothetical protein B0H63DRAFT_537287 [Podospora didyma]